MNQSNKKKALGIFSHPDDAEFLCAGTLKLLKDNGWDIHIASHAPGDKGTAEYTREDISRIRTKEAARSASIIEAAYSCMDMEDVYILYDRENINKTVSLIREVKPIIVFTSSPSDYMIDHEVTSRLAQTACFSAGIMNMEVEKKPWKPVPYLYYCDPMDGYNKFGEWLIPSIYVDISDVISTKEEMLKCHESQRNWLMQHHKIDEYVLSMKQTGAKRGNDISVEYAEGFRQHLGNGFPRENILKEVLGNLVITKNKELYSEDCK